ncbi:MAG: energy transducer TonB [Cytophagales bacterium]
MESKKHASKDLHAQRKKFFLIGLSVSLTLVISAFEWITVKRVVKKPTPDENVITMSYAIPVTTHAIDPPEVKRENIKIETKPILPIEIVTAKDPLESEPIPSPPDNPANSKEIPNFAFASMPPEETDTIVLFPESNAVPVGGYHSFYETVTNKIRYPKQAVKIGVEGKVFVQFIVDKHGQPTDFKISKGIGAGCDEEAIRVLSQTKWEPAKQRGRPVRIRMTIPVIFRLSY